MKPNDRNTIIVVTLISAFAAFFLAKLLIGNPADKQVKVEVVPVISAEFKRPVSGSIFNDQAVNPTQLIKIGESNNTKPFQASQ